MSIVNGVKVLVWTAPDVEPVVVVCDSLSEAEYLADEMAANPFVWNVAVTDQPVRSRLLGA